MTKYTYTIPTDEITSELRTDVVLRSDGAWIPTDPANSDYRQYIEDVTQAVADQAELDAIAKAQADAQADQAARDSADALAAKVKSDAIQRFLSLGFTQLEAEAMLP